MLNEFSRTELLIGKEALNKLKQAKVAIFGIGGVGSYVVEGLARAGVGHFVLIDHDDVSLTNINRQLIATTKTVGRKKVDVAKERVLDINPEALVDIYPTFFNEDTKNMIDSTVSYIVDAIDTVTSKLQLIELAKELNLPIISCMGTGNKLDASKFEITDIAKTSVCPLAKVMRKELKARGIEHVKVLYSKEEPKKVFETEETKGSTNHPVPGSISFVPSVAGLIIAGEVVKDLIKGE